MRVLIALGLAGLLLSCAPARPPFGKAPADYTFAMSSGAGLLALDEQGRILGKIVDTPTEYGIAPGLSLAPDGQTLVFALALPPDAKRGLGTDIFRVNLDGSGLRTIVEHEADGVFYGSPALDSSGQLLYVHRRAAIIEGSVYKGTSDEILRIDLRTGGRTTLVKDGADLTLSPDGNLLVYVHLKNGQPEALWRVNIDGSDARPLLQTRDLWSYQQSPRFSPNGRSIVFCGAGRTLARAGPTEAVSAGGKQLHLSLPSDLVVVDLAGRSVSEVAKTSDDTFPAWPREGSKIVYVTQGALQLLDLGTGSIRELARGDDFNYAEVIWVKR